MRGGEELKKITLNIYRRDAEELERIYQWGWSEKVRQLVRQHLQEMRRRLNERD